MKSTFLTLILLCFQIALSHAQWTRVNAIPDQDIIALTLYGDTLIAASDTNFMYKSPDGGISWTTVKITNQPILVNTLRILGKTMYIGTFRDGIFSSDDGGSTWKQSGSNMAAVSGIEVHDSQIYATTLGDGVFKLDSVSGNWIPFNDSLPSYSYNVNAILSIHQSLLIGAGANGTVYRLNDTLHAWGEEFYYGILRPGLQIQKLLSDSNIVYAVNGNRILRSEDDGITWVDDKTGSHNGYSRTINAGSNDMYTITNITPEGSWIQQRSRQAIAGASWATQEEFIPDGYIYDLIETGNKVFIGKSDGLYTWQPTTGLDQEMSVSIPIAIYPNPSPAMDITVSSTLPIHAFTITNNLGQNVLNGIVNEKQFIINPEFLSGVYILALNLSDGRQVVKKLIIH